MSKTCLPSVLGVMVTTVGGSVELESHSLASEFLFHHPSVLSALKVKQPGPDVKAAAFYNGGQCRIKAKIAEKFVGEKLNACGAEAVF